MQELKDRILKDGKAIGTDILKVDSFLNHQIDVKLLDNIGEEFKKRLYKEGVNKILTVEASGIAIACAASRAMGYLPVVFAKKAAPKTMISGSYTAEVVSFTKGTQTMIRVGKEFLGPQDRVLIIDDFLASGEAAFGLLNILKQAGAECLGIGAVIEKEYQGGSAKLRAMGYNVASLAVITSIENGTINFK